MEAKRKMSSIHEACSHVEPELVAYINGELDSEAQTQTDLHLAECEECRRALDEFREAYRLARTIPMLEPSAAFRAGLERKIAAKVAVAGTPRRGSSRISKRLAALEAARARGGGWAVYVSVSMAAVCAFLFVTQFIIFSSPRREVYIHNSDARRMLADLKYRRECGRRYDTRLDLEHGTLDFSHVLDSGTVRLVGYYETAAPDERCVLAYDIIQWEDLAFRAERAEGDERERLQGLIEKATVAEVVEGTLEIPEGVIAEGLMHQKELTVLPIRRRTEIWATRILREYLGRDYIFKIKIEREAMQIRLFRPGIRTS